MKLVKPRLYRNAGLPRRPNTAKAATASGRAHRSRPRPPNRAAMSPATQARAARQRPNVTALHCTKGMSRPGRSSSRRRRTHRQLGQRPHRGVQGRVPLVPGDRSVDGGPRRAADLVGVRERREVTLVVPAAEEQPADDLVRVAAQVGGHEPERARDGENGRDRIADRRARDGHGAKYRHGPQREQAEDEDRESESSRHGGHGCRAGTREDDSSAAEQNHTGDDCALGQRLPPRRQYDEQHEHGDEADGRHQPQQEDRRGDGDRVRADDGPHAVFWNCIRTLTGALCTALTVAVEPCTFMPGAAIGSHPSGAVTCTVMVDGTNSD